mgnify:CR=1 FL=1
MALSKTYDILHEHSYTLMYCGIDFKQFLGGLEYICIDFAVALKTQFVKYFAATIV